MLLISLFLIATAHGMEQHKSDPRKLYVSYDQHDLICQKLHQKIVDDGFKPEVILGLPRGGLFAAALLASERMFNIRTLSTISVASYDDHMQQSSLKLLFPFHPEDLEKYSKILIVDDLVDSGTTITFVTKLVQSTLKNSCIKTAALFYKPKNAEFKPDYYIEDTDKWIVFPWEKQ
jgi:xanthine phosphoribosyltransferase